MPVTIHIGDLFTSKAQTLVNTVNCVGVMGKGIALEFKNRYPDMFQDYAARCSRGEVKLGEPYLYKRASLPWILNFPTKAHWRNVAHLQAIVKGLEYLLAHYQEWGIESLAVPPLGAGLGQLEWRVIGPTLYRYLNQLTIPVELYAPFETSHAELTPTFLSAKPQLELPGMPEASWIKPGWVALVEILGRIDAEIYHWPVGRTIFQKIAYVATEEGIPTGFSFQRDSYGPFSPDIKPAIARLLNNGLVEESPAGNMIRVQVGRTFQDARAEFADQIQQWDSIINKVTDLFMRLNTSQAELVATVLFAARTLHKEQAKPPTEIHIFDYVMEWKKRRQPPINPDAVADTIRNLGVLNWLQATASPELPLSAEHQLDY
jgi:O-acetyl-ADP-ribose deacetylase (regulator of RNase III)/uncharacterized protein YwgA